MAPSGASPTSPHLFFNAPIIDRSITFLQQPRKQRITLGPGSLSPCLRRFAEQSSSGTRGWGNPPGRAGRGAAGRGSSVPLEPFPAPGALGGRRLPAARAHSGAPAAGRRGAGRGRPGPGSGAGGGGTGAVRSGAEAAPCPAAPMEKCRGEGGGVTRVRDPPRSPASVGVVVGKGLWGNKGGRCVHAWGNRGGGGGVSGVSARGGCRRLRGEPSPASGTGMGAGRVPQGVGAGGAELRLPGHLPRVGTAGTVGAPHARPVPLGVREQRRGSLAAAPGLA